MDTKPAQKHLLDLWVKEEYVTLAAICIDYVHSNMSGAVLGFNASSEISNPHHLKLNVVAVSEAHKEQGLQC